MTIGPEPPPRRAPRGPVIQAASRERRTGLACAYSVLTSWDMAALRYGGAFLAALPVVLGTAGLGHVWRPPGR